MDETDGDHLSLEPRIGPVPCVDGDDGDLLEKKVPRLLISVIRTGGFEPSILKRFHLSDDDVLADVN